MIKALHSLNMLVSHLPINNNPVENGINDKMLSNATFTHSSASDIPLWKGFVPFTEASH